jgi:outer membrane protein insertion porin family
MTTEPTVQHHHRSARERQRKGPMWGCMRALFLGFGGLLVLLVLVIAGGWWYLGTNSFANLVRLRVASTLEARLGRHVEIRDVDIVRGRESRIILKDIRVANAPGATTPYFATVKELVITGGVDSFWFRRIEIGRVDIVEPHLWFEIFPAGSPLVHNFPHWQSGPPSSYEIYHLDLGTMYVKNGAFEFKDRRHDISAVATQLASTIKVTSKEDLYDGTAASPSMTLRIQDYEPVQVAMRGGFRYSPNVLDLSSIALDGGPDLQVFLQGRVAPLADAVYNLRLQSRVGLNRVRQIFRVQKVLEGPLVIDAQLAGRAGTFSMKGGWISPRIAADAYTLTNARGRLDLSDTRLLVDVERAQYAGGTIAAHYVLPQYADPYPMSVDLSYNGISLEKLFADWTIQNTGLRAAATGRLAYHWNKDKLLEGAGEGNAELAKNATAFSHAQYPIPIAGSADYALDNGVVTFRRTELDTGLTHVSLTGKLRIADVWTDLLAKIHSTDFSELDRIGYNFAHSAGKTTYTLLGLGGAGDITGSVRGKLKTPEVVAHIASTGTKYNNVLVGNADIDLKYDGTKAVLAFDRAVFTEGNGRLAMTGTIGFPEKGPSPRFDLSIDAANFPVDRAVAVIHLDLKVSGIGTGRMIVSGTPDSGKATFVNMLIRQPKGDLRLNGTVAWLPGKGNSNFELDIAARDFPVAEITKFLDLANVPVSGELTGTLHISGPKNRLNGAGAVTVRNGVIYGEPVTEGKANIAFTGGTLKATNVSVTAPAGTVTGEGEINFETNRYTYSIQSANLDLAKVQALQSLAGILGGKLTIQSTGAGTLEQPELVLNATLTDATLKGLNLPAGSPPPTVYVAIRNGQLIVRADIAGLVTAEGNGSVAPDGTLSGLVRVRVPDIAKALALSPGLASLPASGSLIADVTLGGKLSSIEALRIDATFPQFDVKVSEHDFVPARPLHVALRGGRIVFDDFDLSLKDTGSTFGVTGYAEVTGAKRLNVNVRGEIEAALAQLFVPGLRADGHIVIAGGVTGTMSDPRLTGTAELHEAQFRFPGFPQLIDHITGTLVFHGDRLEIDSVHANLGGGTIVLGGNIALDGLKPQSARVVVQGTDVAIRYFEGLTVEGNFNLVLSGDAERMRLQGDVNVTRGVYFRDIDIGNAVLGVVLSRRGPTPIVAATWQDHVSLGLHVVANGTLAVRNNLADVTGSGDIEVTGTLANPSVVGLVALDEGGRVRFQNIDYHVVRGSINFQNPFRIDPYFDITLEARVSGGISEIEAGPVDVTLNVTGTIDRITPTITSDPPASDITLFSLLGAGALTRQGSSQTPTDVSTTSRSVLIQSLSRLVGSRVLPFADSFTYDPGLIDTTGDPGPKVSFEKRLSNDIRVFVVYNTLDHKKRIIMEWQVNPDWLLQATRDEITNEYRLEARFRRRYEGHWSWGSQGRNPLALFSRFHEIQAAGQTVALPAPTQTVPPPTGANVTSIAFQADAAFDTSVLRQYVAIKVGQPLALRDVQSSIKSLFATGDFRDVHVDEAPSNGGIAVTFVLSINYRIADIRFDGLGGADRERAARDLTMHQGDVLSLDAVDHSATAVQDFLTRAGYLEAAVDPETTFDRASSQARVLFHVAEGQRARVRDVVIAGNTAPFSSAELIHQMKRGPGQYFEIAQARTDAERMRNYLVRRDYRKAQVRFDRYVYDKNAKSVELRYTATTGPVVQVAVTGVSRRSLRGLLPFARNQAYSEDVIDKAADDIVKFYQQNGYFNAAVDTEEHLAGNVWTTTFHVNPGQHYSLAAVTFTGNQKVSDKALADVVETSTSGGFRSFFARIFRRPTGVTRAQLSADRDAIESYYRLNGFSTVAVATPVVATRNDGTMLVDFPITEGPQTIVTGVALEGVQQVAGKELPPLQLRAGQPLNPQFERADVVALQTFYSDRGNAEVQVKPREEISADKTSARVAYVVAEGPKITVDQVVVRGNTYTKTNVVLRQADLEKSDPFSYTSILEAQRNLYRLGIFQRVDIQPEQAGTSLSQRNVVISVEEGKDVTIAGSVGVTSGITGTGNRLSLLGSVSIANRNLFGTGRYAGLELIWAGQSRKEAFLTYREPFLGPWAMPVQVTAFQVDTLRQGAHIRQRGTFVEATKVARYQTRFSLRYEYRISQCLIEHADDVCSQVAEAFVPGLDRSIANVKISSLTPTFFWDRRDDPIDPHRGFLSSASVEYAFRALAADAHFLKEFTQAAWYLPLGGRSVFGVSGRVGLIQDLGGGLDENGERLSGVPLSERFTAGGDSSHRAFALDLLGTTCKDPRDGGPDCHPTLVILGDGRVAPVGGQALFLFNADYRFPIAGPVGGTVFFDAGNVYSDTRLQFTNLRYGVGAGVRYLSPVGPIRFDIGYKLHRRILDYNDLGVPRYERPFAYFLTLGYAF